MESRRLRAAVVDRHADQDVVRSRLGVLDEDVEVPVVVEDPRVEQLVLELLARPPPVRLEEVPVRELALRVLVEVLHVRVRRRRVEVEVVLLDVLAVVPLAVGEAEQALLQDRVPLVPERERETEALLVVGDPAEAVLAPPVGPGAGLVVREVVPGVAVLAVVLADRAPLPLAQVRAPLLPRDPLLPASFEPPLFGGCRRTPDPSPPTMRAPHFLAPHVPANRADWTSHLIRIHHYKAVPPDSIPANRCDRDRMSEVPLKEKSWSPFRLDPDVRVAFPQARGARLRRAPRPRRRCPPRAGRSAGGAGRTGGREALRRTSSIRWWLRSPSTPIRSWPRRSSRPPTPSSSSSSSSGSRRTRTSRTRRWPTRSPSSPGTRPSSRWRRFPTS